MKLQLRRLARAVAALTGIAVLTGAALLLWTASPAVAQTQTIGDPGPGSASSWAAAGTMNGQFFTVPPGAGRLTDVKLAVGFPDAFNISLYRWTNGAPGPVLASTLVLSNPTSLPSYGLYGPTLPAGGIPVVPGETFAILIDQPYVAMASSAHYADGAAVALGDPIPARDTYFTATFTAAPAPVPTLSEWAMILFGATLAGAAALTIQRRRAA